MAGPEAGSSPPEQQGFKSRIGKKIGPLPIWAWAVLLAAAGFIWWKFFGPGKAAPAKAKAGGKGGGKTEVIEVRGQRGKAGPPGKPGPPGKRGGGSSGPKKVDVPDVRGEPYTKAGKEIKDKGLIAQRSKPFVGRVRSESPYPGSRVEKGTVVTLRGGPWPFLPSPGGGEPKSPAPDMASAGQVVTPQSPAFQSWNDDSGDAMPAYAPMTAGSIHG